MITKLRVDSDSPAFSGRIESSLGATMPNGVPFTRTFRFPRRVRSSHMYSPQTDRGTAHRLLWVLAGVFLLSCGYVEAQAPDEPPPAAVEEAKPGTLPTVPFEMR